MEIEGCSSLKVEHRSTVNRQPSVDDEGLLCGQRFLARHMVVAEEHRVPRPHIEIDPLLFTAFEGEDKVVGHLPRFGGILRGRCRLNENADTVAFANLYVRR